MSVELRNIPGVPAPQNYHHVAIASGTRTIYVAGQTGEDDEGNLAEGLAKQTEVAVVRVGRALEAAGATEMDLVKLTVYIVNWEPSMFEAFGAGMMAARQQRPAPEVPVTLLGVASLVTPAHLVEIEATAVVS